MYNIEPTSFKHDLGMYKLHRPENMAQIGKLSIVDNLVVFTYHFSSLPDDKTVNLQYFIENAIISSTNSTLQFLFIVVGPLPQLLYEELFELSSSFSNVMCFFIKNAHSDPCALSLAFSVLPLSTYVFIFILNDTARGPFGLTSNINDAWFYRFKKHLEGNVKIVGSYLNCEPRAHIQSFAYLMRTSDFIKYSLPSAQCSSSKMNIIRDYEIGASQMLLKDGFSIKGFYPPYEKMNKSTNCVFMHNPTVWSYGEWQQFLPNIMDIVFFKSAGTGVPRNKNVDFWTAIEMRCLKIFANTPGTYIKRRIEKCLYSSTLLRRIQSFAGKMKSQLVK